MTRVLKKVNMAANQNSRGGTNSGFGGTGQSPFFSQSLGGGLTVDSLSGPLLFTPVPLSPPIEPAVDQRNVSGKKYGLKWPRLKLV